MKLQTDLSVCIINWNTSGLLRNCLQSLFYGLPFPEMELIVVDNGSNDDSAAMVRSVFPNVRLIANRENRGFTTALNQAIAIAKGSYIAVLHADVLCDGEALRTMADFLDTNPSVGIVGPLTRYPNGELLPTCFSFHSLRTQLFSSLWLDRLAPKSRTFGRYALTNWDHSAAREVDWVSYSCLMFRQALVRQIGSWDEGFFVWVADEDFCLRAKRTGWLTYFLPSAKIVHLERLSTAASVYDRSPALEYKQKWHVVSPQMVQALCRYQRKHHGLIRSSVFCLLLFAEFLNRIAVWSLIRFCSSKRRQEASERVVFYTGALRTLLNSGAML